MRVLIATPLFPPDTAESASYSKELCRQLTGHEVSLLIYGHLPEIVSGVEYFCVDKRQNTFWRIFRFTTKLVTEAGKAEHVIIQNGPSAELPALIASFFTRTPFILSLSDGPALKRTVTNKLSNFVHQWLSQRCIKVLNPNEMQWPIAKPIIHPIHPYPTTKMQEFETKWNDHIKTINSLFQ